MKYLDLHQIIVHCLIFYVIEVNYIFYHYLFYHHLFYHPIKQLIFKLFHHLNYQLKNDIILHLLIDFVPIDVNQD